MTVVGLHCSHEQMFPPRQLLADVQAAEEAGRTPPCARTTGRPGDRGRGSYRYHPAIIAQASATLAQMFPGRLWVALGSGEYSNEFITGEAWPCKAERQELLLECADTIRRLHRGETVTHKGHVTVSEARLWTLPEKPPELIQPAVSVETARQGAAWADGVATINQPLDTLKGLVAAYREAGGAGTLTLQVHVSWAPTEDEAWGIARDQWSTNVFPPPVCWDLTTSQLDIVSRNVSDDQITPSLIVSSDHQAIAAQVRQLVDLGFDEVYLHHVGQSQARFIDTFAEHVLPQLRG